MPGKKLHTFATQKINCWKDVSKRKSRQAEKEIGKSNG